MDVNK